MAKKSKKHGAGCKVKKVSFNTKRDGHVEFKAHVGSDCKPAHHSTAHLRTHKSAFKKAVNACSHASHKRHGKHGKSAFNTCIGKKLK